jgi:hypothetical protein
MGASAYVGVPFRWGTTFALANIDAALRTAREELAAALVGVAVFEERPFDRVACGAIAETFMAPYGDAAVIALTNRLCEITESFVDIRESLTAEKRTQTADLLRQALTAWMCLVKLLRARETMIAAAAVFAQLCVDALADAPVQPHPSATARSTHAHDPPPGHLVATSPIKATAPPRAFSRTFMFSGARIAA